MSDINDFQIDPHALDEEWLRQASLYHSYATKLADARRGLDEAKVNVARIEAELQLGIRQTPADYDVVKVTDASVSAAVLDQPIHAKASNAVIVAKHVVDLLHADCNALEQKCKALENLVRLHGMDYYAEPRADTPESQEAVEDIQKTSARTQGRKRRRERAEAADNAE